MKSHPSRGSRLFAEPDHTAQSAGAYTMNIDGAARGNPGPAAYGVVILKPDGTPQEGLKKYLGRATNNVAEYYALIAALDYATAHGIRKLRIRSDSELLVQQMRGIYKVKSADLRPLHERAKKLAAALDYFEILHVRRELNAAADALANEALDSPGSHHVTTGFSRAGSSEKQAGLRPALTSSKYARSVRAVYRNGALHPSEPIDVPEGTEVEITISGKPRQ